MANKKKKNSRWCRWRHKLTRFLVSTFFGPYVRLRYHARIDKLGEKNERQYLILYNHETGFDQFFVGMSFKRPVYYVASEDIFSMGLLSKLIKFLVNPIPIKKQTTDPRAVINCIKVAREGGTIAIAPEGNRTFHGRPVYIKDSIASLAKHLKLPIAIFRIEGGFGVHPRWSDVIRGGRMHTYVKEIIEPETYKNMTDEALADMIREKLYVDETEIDGEYPHERCAEYLERALYYCPSCGISELESHGDVIRCKRCGTSARYTAKKTFVSDDPTFPYRNVAEWYDAQSAYMNSFDTTSFGDTPIQIDLASFYEVILYKKKIIIYKNAEIVLKYDRLTVKCGEQISEYLFDDITGFTVLGKNKLNIYLRDGHVYQIKGGKRLSGLKYMNVYYRYIGIKKGEENGQFLGL